MVFSTKNTKIFLGLGHTPSLYPSPVGRGIPSPHVPLLSAPAAPRPLAPILKSWVCHCCFADVIVFFIFSVKNLQGRSVDRQEILTRVRWWAEFIKFGQKFRSPSPQKLTTQQKHWKTSQRDREYLRKETRYRWTENGVANCNLSCARVQNLVNFGPQTAKNRIRDSTDLTRSRCVGHVP